MPDNPEGSAPYTGPPVESDRSRSSRPSHPPALLALRGVAYRRGDRLLFSDVDLAVGPGGCTWVRGGNGVGKTSLLRIAAGLAAPAAGQVLRDGGVRPLVVGHANALNADLSAAEALAFLARVQGAPTARGDVTRALDALGLARAAHGAPVGRLSQGQRRRVALARLALAPSAALLWLLDEPFDALDADGIARVEARVADHRAAGGGVVLTSHRALSGPALGGPVELLDLGGGPDAP